VVLIDERSASAAEALASSLQDHDRALLVGRRSFGKALMQSIFFLPSGDIVWLTVGRVITPSGRVIQRRYHGVGYEQYLSFAGKSGAEEDTMAVFKTDAGRSMRGGGGIVPDVIVPVTASLPVWWSAAADSGFDDAVSDSVAQTFPATPAARKAWLTADSEWRTKLLPPFLARVMLLSRRSTTRRSSSRTRAKIFFQISGAGTKRCSSPPGWCCARATTGSTLLPRPRALPELGMTPLEMLLARRREGRSELGRPADAVALGPQGSTSSRSRARPARSACRPSAAPKPGCSTSASTRSRSRVAFHRRGRATSRSATARRAKASSGSR
jgi:hypothetical protein